ncbi:thiamine kinase [Acerihabitans arboris]|uniref:Thiamine kinase n=1 Tax=Acerihabitans arboris TaxID=2691583 RepID=A0A845SFP9_9GAMM|nr:thiamine kinase [Acerihabitans arboris]NDL61906.1 thiamine kinase [Acerihabitans arboris]
MRKSRLSLDELLTQVLPQADAAGCLVEPVDGLTGASWRIRAAGVDWLAREASPSKQLLGVDRRREFRLLRRLPAGTPAPAPRTNRAQWLLVDWLPGETLPEAGWQAEMAGGALAALLAQLHRGPRYGYPIALRARYAAYWQASDPSRRCPAWLRLQQRFMRAKMPSTLSLAPLHMDIHPGNVLRGRDGGLRLIDWEYAGDGDIALELAALFRGNGLDGRRQAGFLLAYQARSPGYAQDVLRRRIAAWAPWVDYLMLMWYEVRWRQTRQRQFLQYAAPLRRNLGLPF